MSGKRISQARLVELDRIVSERDKEILLSLMKCRYLTSGQIQRLHFTENISQRAALQATNRVLARLREYDLVHSLERRIGGKKGGSGSAVWQLVDTGFRLLHLQDKNEIPRKRLFTPSVNFLVHTLMTSECYIQITELCKNHNMRQIRTELEPSCWRSYIRDDGTSGTLKPDLFSVISNGDYEDSWFIEVDMNTESPAIVVDKCRRYAQYYKNGTEQKKYGVFPQVVWIVPTPNRKESLKRNIAECEGLTPKNMFLVILQDEFETLLCKGPEALINVKGELAA